jgi:hypothetical protein
MTGRASLPASSSSSFSFKHHITSPAKGQPNLRKSQEKQIISRETNYFINGIYKTKI